MGSPGEEALIDRLQAVLPLPCFPVGGSGERIQPFWLVALSPQTRYVVTKGMKKKKSTGLGVRTDLGLNLRSLFSM